MNRFRQQESPLGCTVASIYVYSPPKHQITIQEYTKLFNHLGLQWILSDDFNTKHRYWSSRLDTSKDCRHLNVTDRIKAVCFSNTDNPPASLRIQTKYLIAKKGTAACTSSQPAHMSYLKEIVENVKEKKKVSPEHKAEFSNISKQVKSLIKKHNDDSFHHFVISLELPRNSLGHSPPICRLNNR